MRFLLTNDDGIDAPGIYALAKELKKMGEVLVVAPEREMSGSGHAFTKRNPLRLRPFHKDGEFFGYATTGTPTDSVKLGLFLAKRKVDWVISGINDGGNLGVDLFYSGTVSGAIEGAIDGFPSIAFSLTTQGSLYPSEPRYEEAAEIARELLERIQPQVSNLKSSKSFKNLDLQFPSRLCLNVNIPNLPRDKIQGIKVAEQALQRYEDYFDVGEDPFGEPYYWLTGAVVDEDHCEDSDLAMIKEGFITITPLRIDLTDRELLERMRRWELKF
jgi:5'-nucleotidase